MIDKNRISATEPKKSACIYASAGSGKTTLLVNKILRLLISGEKFNSFLCITYTNIAAAEMKNRLKNRLSALEKASHNEITNELNNLFGREPMPDEINLAKKLYKEFLINIDNINIQTIHSFCKKLLEKFTIETGFNINNKIIEEAQTRPIIKNLIEIFFLKTESEYHEGNFELLTQNIKNEDLLDIIYGLDKYEFYKVLTTYDKKNYESRLKDFLCISDFEKNYAEETELDYIKEKLIKYNLQDSTAYKNFSNGEYPKILLNKKIFKVSEHKTNLIEIKKLEEEIIKFSDYKIKETLNDKVKLTIALIDFAKKILEELNNYKKLNSSYCFNDYITKASQFIKDTCNDFNLKNSIFECFPIKHVFLDEAQDTLPQQWEFIILWLETFFTNPDCTVFIVGDKKQSIYSFSGSKYWLFDAMFLEIERIVKNIGGHINKIYLQESFRTTKEVLELVNEIFFKGGNNKFKDEPEQKHVREYDGSYKIFNIKDDNKTNDENQDNKEKVFFTTAQLIQDILDQNKKFPKTGNKITANDILVLTRNKKNIDELSKFFFNSGIPFFNMHKVQINNSITWQDLVSFVKFLSHPNDDFNTACLLKSPFFNDGRGISEDNLFEICSEKNEKKRSIFTCITADYECADYECKDELSNLKNQIKIILLRYYNEAKTLSNKKAFYDFFYKTLTNFTESFAFATQQKFVIVFDTFLDEIYNFLKTEPPNLFNLYKHLGNFSLRRNGATSNNCVKINTIHGAKGCESPIVILVNPIGKNSNLEKILWIEESNSLNYENHLLLLKPEAPIVEYHENLKRICDEIKQHSAEEKDRLLYVALTRAEYEIYIIGDEKNDFQKIINDAVKPEDDKIFLKPIEQKSITTEKIKIHYKQNNWSEKAPQKKIKKQEKSDDSFRGILIHNLIDKICKQNLSTEEAEQFVLQDIKEISDFDDGKIEKIISTIDIKKILSIKMIPEFSFLENGKQEVSVFKNGEIFRLDNLYISKDKIVIIEIKTTHDVPKNNSEIPEDYKRQLENYSKIIKEIFPEKKIDSYFLWTEAPKFYLFTE